MILRNIGNTNIQFCGIELCGLLITTRKRLEKATISTFFDKGDVDRLTDALKKIKKRDGENE